MRPTEARERNSDADRFSSSRSTDPAGPDVELVMLKKGPRKCRWDTTRRAGRTRFSRRPRTRTPRDTRLDPSGHGVAVLRRRNVPRRHRRRLILSRKRAIAPLPRAVHAASARVLLDILTRFHPRFAGHPDPVTRIFTDVGKTPPRHRAPPFAGGSSSTAIAANRGARWRRRRQRERECRQSYCHTGPRGCTW